MVPWDRAGGRREVLDWLVAAGDGG
jgi:hypothetical protein